MNERELRAAARLHVLGGLLPRLGSRILHVARDPSDADLLADCAGRMCVRVHGAPGRHRRTTCGAPPDLPIQSGAVTGVVYSPTDRDLREHAVRELAEVHRVLQPSGTLAIHQVLPGAATPGEPSLPRRHRSTQLQAIEEHLSAAGLVFTELRAVQPLRDPSGLQSAARGTRLPRALAVRLAAVRATRRLRAGAGAEVFVLAARPGGLGTGIADLPDMRETISSMFIPPSWTRRGRKRR